MTKAEHSKAYRAARSVTARQVIEGKRKIHREYLRIVSGVAKVVRGNLHKPFLEEQIKAAFPREEMFNWIKSLVLNGRVDTARLVADIEKRHIFEALDKVPGHGLSKEKIAAMFDAKIERAKIANSVPFCDIVHNAQEKKYTGTGFAYRPEGKWKKTRVDYTFRQSHSLSKSVWDSVDDAEGKILDVVWGGISQGRDIKTVAADLMAYAHGGPTVIPGRWGKLQPGTREYVRRLGKAGVDYRAMRLYRSEKYRHLQEAAVEDGESNPACTGEYDWIFMPGRENWACDCPETAAAGPYRANNIPPYRHPNCDCLIEPRMKDHDAFIQQLRDYANGADTPGAHEIEEWALGNDLKDINTRSAGFDWDQKLQEAIANGVHSEWEARRLGELAYAKAQRESKSILDVIKELRMLGTGEEHTFSTGSDFSAEQWVKDMMRCFPAAWLDLSAEMSRINPITTVLGKRNYYDPVNNLLSTSAAGTKTIHEVAHRMQQAIPLIRKYEAEFYKRRTKDEVKVLLSTFAKYANAEGADRVWTRIDKFKDPYMGIDYGNKNRYEVFTTGIEDLWFSIYNADREYLNFVVGILLGV